MEASLLHRNIEFMIDFDKDNMWIRERLQKKRCWSLNYLFKNRISAQSEFEIKSYEEITKLAREVDEFCVWCVVQNATLEHGAGTHATHWHVGMASWSTFSVRPVIFLAQNASLTLRFILNANLACKFASACASCLM